MTAVAGNSLTVRGTTVRVEATTRIRHGHRILSIGDIHVADRVEARGTMDGTTLVASEIKVEDTGRDDEDDDEDDEDDEEDDEAEVKGVISGLTPGTCPTLTFTVGTTSVTTNRSTVFDDVTCEALANGARVEVEGERQSNGSIVAKKVERDEDEVEGRVSELGGTCPGLTFKVGSRVVTTSVATTFTGVACGAVANEMELEVEGMQQANGSIAAASVKRDSSTAGLSAHRDHADGRAG